MSAFIEWHGGGCPVKPDTKVEVKRRNGLKIQGFGRSFYWNHNGWPGDILAYRVMSDKTKIGGKF